MSFSTLFAGLIFGTFGIYFIKRGKTEAAPVRIIIGVILIVFPYFVSQPLLLWSLGAGLMFAGFKLR